MATRTRARSKVYTDTRIRLAVIRNIRPLATVKRIRTDKTLKTVITRLTPKRVAKTVPPDRVIAARPDHPFNIRERIPGRIAARRNIRLKIDIHRRARPGVVNRVRTTPPVKCIRTTAAPKLVITLAPKKRVITISPVKRVVTRIPLKTVDSKITYQEVIKYRSSNPFHLNKNIACRGGTQACACSQINNNRPG